MIGLIISWGIVLTIASVFLVDFRGLSGNVRQGVEWLFEGIRNVINQLGVMTEKFYKWLMELPYRYRPRTYTHTGRHRRDNPPDPEVDLWPGANDEWVDTLRGLNAG